MARCELSGKSPVVKKTFLYICIVLAMFFTGCETPEIPTWITTINFPLINTEYSFSQMVDSEDGSPFISDSTNNIITILFEDDILEKSDSLGVNENYFLTPEFSLDDIEVNENQSIEFPSINSWG